MDKNNLSSYVLLESMRRKGANVWSEETDLFLAKVKHISFAEARRLKMEWVKEYDAIESFLEEQSLISPRTDGWKPQSEESAEEQYKNSRYALIRKGTSRTSVRPFKMSEHMVQKLNEVAKRTSHASSEDFERQK